MSETQISGPVLAFCTVQRTTGVALGDGDGVELHIEEGAPYRHSRALLLRANALLSARGIGPTDLGCVAVCTGPGSYTGIRVGLASARALAFASNVPLCGIDAFAACAEGGELSEAPDAPRVVAIDARRGRVYVKALDSGGGVLGEPQVCVPVELRRRLEERSWGAPVHLLGDAAEAYPDDLAGLDGVHVVPSEAALVRPDTLIRMVCQNHLAANPARRPEDVLPVYVQDWTPG